MSSTDQTTQRGTPLEIFLAVRPRLHALAFRVVKNASDTDDVLQETWIRWQLTKHAQIRNPEAFLSTVATRLALNVLTDAAHRHGARPPAGFEPIDERTPEAEIETQSDVEDVLLVLLSALDPRERAALVLREAFKDSYSEIAGVIGIREPAARQVVSRAKRKLPAHTATVVDIAEHRRLVTAFREASRTGDLTPLRQTLARPVGEKLRPLMKEVAV